MGGWLVSLGPFIVQDSTIVIIGARFSMSRKISLRRPVWRMSWLQDMELKQVWPIFCQQVWTYGQTCFSQLSVRIHNNFWLDWTFRMFHVFKISLDCNPFVTNLVKIVLKNTVYKWSPEHIPPWNSKSGGWMRSFYVKAYSHHGMPALVAKMLWFRRTEN